MMAIQFWIQRILSALRITRPLSSVAVPETQVATFECEVSHFNVPSTWLRDGVEVEMSEKFSMVVSGKLHQLKIMNSSMEDSAEYSFVCGNDRVSAMLTVNRKLLPFPSFTAIQMVSQCRLGDQRFLDTL